MSILDVYSKRKKKERGEVPDVFAYNEFSPTLRAQIAYVLHDAIGVSRVQFSNARSVYAIIVGTLSRQYGVFKLAEGTEPEQVLINFILQERDIERVLDAIEVSFRALRAAYNQGTNLGCSYGVLELAKQPYPDAVNELNARFLEAGVGYQFVSGEIVRKDSEFLHTQVVKPAFELLQGSMYRGAHDEFLRAHEQYRRGDIKGSLVECLKSLESTLKTICGRRHWPFRATDTAKGLLETCFAHGLIPPFLESHYSAIRTTLESGVPTIRNRLGGHGQGEQIVQVPPHYAAYMLHLTGTAICFLVEAEKALP